MSISPPKKIFLLIILTLCICLSSCDQTPSQIETKIDQQPTKHTLWKVKGKTNTFYLLGSIHMLTPEHYPLPTAYEDAFNDAEKLVFEIDESILDPAAAQSSIISLAQLPSGKQLAELIDEKVYLEIKNLARLNHVPMFLIDPVDPWFSSLNLINMQYMNAGLSPEFGIDQHYMRRALDQGKPVLGLETIEDQFSMFDSISMHIQTDMLIDALKQEVDVKEFIDSMIDEWKEGDMEALENLLQDDFSEHEEVYDKLLKNRNHNWIKQFHSMLEAPDDYLVIVGAAHMLGKDGVVQLLKNEGYHVEQL